MDTLLRYIKDIGFFLILVSVVCNALPENSYKKYCKLFCGLVLVVLVITPFKEMLDYDGSISDIFKSKSYQTELMELEAGLKLQDEMQFESMLNQYEESVRDELQTVAEDEGLYIIDVNIAYGYVDDAEDIQLESIDLRVTELAEHFDMGIGKNNDINLDEIHIDNIEINIDRGDDKENGSENDEDNTDNEDNEGISQLSPADRPRVIKLIEKVSELLGIETYLINVIMEQ